MITKRLEEYLEIIYDIIEQKGYARAKDIVKAMNVSPPTVTEMLQKLDREGFINYEKYGGVTLTEKGKRIVKNLEERHETLKNFFILIGIDEKIADDDACKIEHIASNETMEILTKFVEFMQKHEKPKWLERFKIYCNEGEFIKCPKTKKKIKK